MTTLQEMYDALTAEQKALVDARVAALSQAETQLRSSVSTLRQWAADADATTATSGNAVVVLNTVVDRLGVFFDRFADLLVLLGRG